ncbi:hypothetical protein E2562_032097 [Oryza meyeriana var. granulata]|uniref:Uncharacterized protein n=1 Tax=Oryza meyeriana var. granulata TaxID=110450 RepID=A0A6G1CK36_9ORYZ|nr:hypothetical protein E2562_032097 [Oryza meyeriana var. granulata]
MLPEVAVIPAVLLFRPVPLLLILGLEELERHSGDLVVDDPDGDAPGARRRGRGNDKGGTGSVTEEVAEKVSGSQRKWRRVIGFSAAARHGRVFGGGAAR